MPERKPCSGTIYSTIQPLNEIYMMECAAEHIDVPKELVWDYVEAPMDLLWRLQRISDFFPACGTDRKTVEMLFDHLGSLELEEGKSRLIAIYYEAWNNESREKD